jgi:hypothetical protein
LARDSKSRFGLVALCLESEQEHLQESSPTAAESIELNKTLEEEEDEDEDSLIPDASLVVKKQKKEKNNTIPGSVIERLIQCVTASADQGVRSWSLAALSSLLFDARFRDVAAARVLPALCSVLHSYAATGDDASSKGSGQKQQSTTTDIPGAAAEVLAKLRLAALSVSCLLTLAYHHQPSVETLRVNFHIEPSLYRLLRRKDVCRRVKRYAAHLLLLLCADDIDRVLSGEKRPGDARKVSADYRDGPLARLSKCAHGDQASSKGIVLEETFLRLLTEQMGPVVVEAKAAEHDEEDNDAQVGYGGPSWWVATENESSHGGLSAASAAKTSASNNPDKEPSRRSSSGNDIVDRMAYEFGFLGNASEGDELGVERDKLLQLCLQALTDLAARRDKTKAAIINGGGAVLVSRLLREAHTNTGQVFDDDEEGFGNDFDINSLSWRRTKPLHLLLNCSSIVQDDVQLKICQVCLDDLMRATTSMVALECQLAYGKLRSQGWVVMVLWYYM